MLFLVFYFILSAILVFQGLHLAAETSSPLGTLPEEVAQERHASRGWGGLLMAYGGFSALIGALGFAYPGMAPARPILFMLGWIFLALFALWILFLGRQAEFMGKPTVTDDHGHH
ncbi:MAG TPA: hypothetical protein VF804_02165 [Holophagaceae bacterium]